MLSALRLGLNRVWMLDGVADRVSREWPGHGTGEAVVLYWRARWLMLLMSAMGFAVATLGLVLSLAGYRGRWSLFLVGGLILIVQQATLQAFRLWLLFKIGGWSRKNRGPVRRAEQPAKFWAWAVASGTVLIVEVAAASFLVWDLASSR